MLQALWAAFDSAGLSSAWRFMLQRTRRPKPQPPAATEPGELEDRINLLLARRLRRLVLPRDIHALYLARTGSGNRKMLASWCAWVGWLNLPGLPFDFFLLPEKVLPTILPANIAVSALFLGVWQLLKRGKLAGVEPIAVNFLCICMLGFTGYAGLMSDGQALLEHYLTGGVVIVFTAVMFVRLEPPHARFLGLVTILMMLGFIGDSRPVNIAAKIEWAFFDSVITIALIHGRQVQNLYQYRLFLLQSRDELRNSATTRQNDHLSSIAYVDKLTELPNRRYFDEICSSVSDQTKNLLPLSVCLMDIDQFKRLNDRLGHIQGDRCLRVVANAIRTQLRGASDILARYGGEEFVLLLPQTEQAAAVVIAERIRQAVMELNHPHPAVECGVVTISIGVAAASTLPLTVEDLLNQADMALYRAKSAGRNQVRTQNQLVANAA